MLCGGHRGGRVVDGIEKLTGAERQPNGNWRPDWPCLAEVLERADVRDMKLLPSGSNYVFVVALEDPEAGSGAAIYKPRRGEAPLWDYPDGTLYRRERAAYLLSEALGWRLVPPTVVRDGPHGVGAVQLHIDHRPRHNYFTIKEDRQDDLRRMALFDLIANNGDRKGGHCLIDHDGWLWGIDHGLTFHQQGKLRTVIWDFVGEPISTALLEDVERLQRKLECVDAAVAELDAMLEKGERKALRQRVERILTARRFPEPPPWRPVPWPAL
jgi:uncharacterized repeat protein (TIGR03843 family)